MHVRTSVNEMALERALAVLTAAKQRIADLESQNLALRMRLARDIVERYVDGQIAEARLTDLNDALTGPNQW
jgi:hypothetical protein